MPEEKKWMIMAYMAADDVLSDFAVGSLQQLRRVANQEANVVVAAQFDANGKRNISRLVFEGSENKLQSIHFSEKAAIAADTDMAEPRSLTSFINWAYAQRPADYYCLVLWGHGPELLTTNYPALPDGQKAKRFLTALDVKKGLADSKLVADNRKIKIVAVDACNMSMVELACEIAHYAEFLVASEEEVPDFSFPYDRLLLLGQSNSEDEIARTCQELPKRYIEAYQDYILTQATQTDSITLSSLSLKDAGAVTKLLWQLSDAFMAIHDGEKRKAIIRARANSQSFVAGLYVDLYDFCERLLSELDSRRVDDRVLTSVCQNICDAIQLRGNDAFVIANEVSKNERCHGVTLYFPYLADSTKVMTNATFERGGMHARRPNGPELRGSESAIRGGNEFTGRGGLDAPNQRDAATTRGTIDALNKGTIDALNKGTIDALNKERRQRIEETEQYYPHLKFSAETCWDKFIRHCWSRWLAEDAEEQARRAGDSETSEILNQHYSAQQCALNLLSLCRELERGAANDCEASSKQPLSQERRGPLNRGIQ